MTNKEEKSWFKKIIFGLSLTGTITGVTGLILGSVSVNKNNELTYYLKPNYQAVFGKGIVWQTEDYSHDFVLYISPNKKIKTDIEWNGKYPKGYFENEK